MISEDMNHEPMKSDP